ncbi:hypothetical protein NPX13_g4355 [Xylaria arbuscula]|uniref:DNL-type domain-containing protein n=1 Tax=Xylaria arbuscula TaxID=114810 RepID=A0A9W8NGI5_9PEZI|nr:hypothetical protein NPX13_g4355 [Xylaria arbuscula]
MTTIERRAGLGPCLAPTRACDEGLMDGPARPAQDGSAADANSTRKQLEPHYQLTFTCVPCTHRSTHIVSKQGYHKGSVLISCPSCRNRHVISDNLNIFGDRKITVEELLREKGQLVKRGTLGEDSDIEFWADDTKDPSGASEATATLSDQELGDDEAMRMQETRDPSSQATDPTPSVSGLPGDTATRPSVQNTPHQNTTPSTRRQYSTKRSQDTTIWKQHIKSMRQQSLAFEAEDAIPFKDADPSRKLSYGGENANNLEREDAVRTKSRAPLLARLEAMSRKENVGPSREIQRLRASMASINFSELDALPPARRYQESSYKRPWRRVRGNAEYKGPRFITSEHPFKITAQITPGIVSYYRPPRGEPVEKPPVPNMNRKR